MVNLFRRFQPKPLHGRLELDRTHPLARGLIGYWVFIPGAPANSRNLAQPRQADLTIGSGVSVQVVDGVVCLTGGNTGTTDQAYLSGDTTMDSRTGHVTVACRVLQTGGDVNGTSFGTKRTSGNFAEAYSLFYRQPYGMSFFVNDGNGPSFLSGGTYENKWNDLAGTYDGATVRAFANGAQVGSASYSTALFTGAGNFTTNGGYVGDHGFAGGGLDWLGVWERALSPGELRELQRNPYQLLKAPLARAGFPVPAIGKGAGGSSPQTLTAGAPTITLTAPAATRVAGAVTRAATAPTITLTAPPATRVATRSLTAGAPTVNLTAPAAAVVPGASVRQATAPTVTFTAPAAGVSTTGGGNQTLSAGAPLVTLTAPAATLVPGLSTRVATAPLVTFSIPAYTLVNRIVRQAGAPTVLVTAPPATLVPGASVRQATAPTVLFTAPYALITGGEQTGTRYAWFSAGNPRATRRMTYPRPGQGGRRRRHELPTAWSDRCGIES